MGQQAKYLGIGPKIMIMVFALVVATSTAVGFSTYRRFSKALVSRELDALSTLARIASTRVVAAIKTLHDDTQVLAGLPAVHGIARARQSAEGLDPVDGWSEERLRDRLGKSFAGMLEAKPQYARIRYIVLNEGKREIIRVDRSGPQSGIRILSDDSSSQPLGEDLVPLVQEAMKLPGDQIVISNIEIISKTSGLQSLSSPSHVIRAAAPIPTPAGEPFGVVVIERVVTPLFEEILQGLDDSQSLRVTNDAGEFLLHPDNLASLPTDRSSPRRIHEEFPKLAAILATRDVDQQSIVEKRAEGGPRALGVYKAAFDRNRPERFLAFILAVPYDVVVAESVAARNASLLAAAIVLLPAIGIGYALSRTLARPLQQMTAAVSAFGRGESSIELPIAAADETGVVARALAEMMDQVRCRAELLESEIAERRLAEQLVRDQAARIHAIVNSVVDAIITINADGTVESLNPAAVKMFGFTADEVVGKNVKTLMPEPFRGEHDQYLRNYLQSGIPKIIGIGREVTAVRKDGTTFPIDLAVSEVKLDGRRMFTGIIRDMTERKAAEQLAAEQSARIEAILNGVIDAIITINPDGTIESLNRAAERMFGYSAGEMVGQNVKMLMPQPFRGEHDQYLRNYLQTGQAKVIGIGREVIAVRKDGTEFPIDLAVTEVSFFGRRMFTGVIRDITERKRSEFELLQANRELARRAAAIERFNQQLSRSNDELKQFAYVASHDLQEPLRKVTSFCEMLRDEYQDRLDGEALTYIDYAVGGARRMRALVSDLLEYSRVETQGKPLEPVPAGEALRDAVENLELTIAESGAEIDCGRLPLVSADRAQLVRLFQNLIANAIKYRSDAPPRIRVWAESEEEETIFHVEDNGIGIDPQYFARIFVIFQRLHSRDAYPGTGIGLAICKRIVERFGGRIWVTSAVGQGSDFCFALPKVDATTEKPSTKGQDHEQPVDQFALQAD
jgi:two-component system sensor kinase FixL